MHILTDYGKFRWPNKKEKFKITKGDNVRINSWFDGAAREGRMVKGLQKAKAWIGFAVISRLVACYLHNAALNGCFNWDVIMCDCLSIVLVASLGCRSGEVHLSTNHKEDSRYYMRWEHIEMIVDDTETNDVESCLSNLRVHIKVEYRKGEKDQKNKHTTYILKSLNNPDFYHVDPCLLLLINALRRGQTQASTVSEVLLKALQEPDRRIVWKNPQQPVIPRRFKSKTHLILDTPATTLQPLWIIKAMGVNAGLVGRVYMHALRDGHARDFNHVDKEELNAVGFTTDQTRQVLGHTHNAANRGVTDDYSGEHTMAVWNAISANP